MTSGVHIVVDITQQENPNLGHLWDTDLLSGLLPLKESRGLWIVQTALESLGV